MDGLSIKEIHRLYSECTAVITAHTKQRCRERGISTQEVEDAIMSGEIIEQYPDDYPFPSCLILGHAEGNPLHVVVGLGGGRIWIITAYRPDCERWSTDYRERKEK